MPQPDANTILSVAFSSPSQRMAVSAGPAEDQTSLYVNSHSAPAKFKVYWSPDTEFHMVGTLAWSPDESALAFIGMSGSRTTKPGEAWLYILDLASGEIRKVLKIIEERQGKPHLLVNVVSGRMALAWFGNNKVCMLTTDNSIIAVDCADGHIDTLIPAQDCNIWWPVSVSPNKLRFLKRRPAGQGLELEPCEFDGTKVISFGIIPITAQATLFPWPWLSADGKYAFIYMKAKPASVMPDNAAIFDLSQWASVKEIPLTAESSLESYGYTPVTVLQGKQLVLIEEVIDKRSLQCRCRLCTVKL